MVTWIQRTPVPDTSDIVLKHFRIWITRRSLRPPVETWDGLGGNRAATIEGKARKTGSIEEMAMVP
jgi:hypothetical protein